MCPAFRARPHAPFASVGVAVPQPEADRKRTPDAAVFFHSLPGGSCAVVRRKSPRTGEQGRRLQTHTGSLHTATRGRGEAPKGSGECRAARFGQIVERRTVFPRFTGR